VKTLAIKPTVRVTANPLIGPVPNQNEEERGHDVVTMRVDNGQERFVKPASTAAAADLPITKLLRGRVRTPER